MKRAAGRKPDHDPFGITDAIARASESRAGGYRLLAHALGHEVVCLERQDGVAGVELVTSPCWEPCGRVQESSVP